MRFRRNPIGRLARARWRARASHAHTQLKAGKQATVNENPRAHAQPGGLLACLQISLCKGTA